MAVMTTFTHAGPRICHNFEVTCFVLRLLKNFFFGMISIIAFEIFFPYSYRNWHTIRF